MLSPIRDSFLFVFFNDTSQGRFHDRSKSGIILTNNDFDSQHKYARWAKVLAVGPEVKDFKNGAIVLIEYGRWTQGFKYDDVDIWKSDARQVCAIGADESVTYQYK